MDSLFNILSDKNFDEPPEAASIKKFIQDTFQAPATVQVRADDVIVTVANGMLANALRLKSSELKRRCQLTKRLVIKVG